MGRLVAWSTFNPHMLIVISMGCLSVCWRQGPRIACSVVRVNPFLELFALNCEPRPAAQKGSCPKRNVWRDVLRLPSLVGVRRLILVLISVGIRVDLDHAIEKNPHTGAHIALAVCLVDRYARQPLEAGMNI